MPVVWRIVSIELARISRWALRSPRVDHIAPFRVSTPSSLPARPSRRADELMRRSVARSSPPLSGSKRN